MLDCLFPVEIPGNARGNQLASIEFIQYLHIRYLNDDLSLT